jgi:DNA primase
MKDPQGSEAREYLSLRGIHSEVCKTFGMGFAPPGWRSLAAVLKKKDVGIDAAIESGLLVKGDAGKDPYDRFRNRIVFPIKDLSGRILGFGGRVMGEELPKYVNTSETPVYRKGDFLFGMDVAAPYIREEGQVILVEGYLDSSSPGRDQECCRSSGHSPHTGAGASYQKVDDKKHPDLRF